MTNEVNGLSPALRAIVAKDGKIDMAKLQEVANSCVYSQALKDEAATLLNGNKAWNDIGDSFVASSPYLSKQYTVTPNPIQQPEEIDEPEEYDNGKKYYYDEQGRLISADIWDTHYDVEYDDNGEITVKHITTPGYEGRSYHEPQYEGELHYSKDGRILSSELKEDYGEWNKRETFIYGKDGKLKSIITVSNAHYEGEGFIGGNPKYIVMQQDFRYNQETSQYEASGCKVLGLSDSDDYKTSGLQKVDVSDSDEYWEVGEELYDKPWRDTWTDQDLSFPDGIRSW